MKISRFNVYSGESKTKAFFDIETNEGIVIKGFKLVLAANGLFVSNPSHYSEKDKKWFDDVFIPRELKDTLDQDAIQQYNAKPAYENKEDKQLPPQDKFEDDIDLPF